MMQRRDKKEGLKEEFAIILDVIIENQSSFKDNELAQAIGLTNFTLLELVPRPSVILKTGDKVYIGDGKRDEVQYIKRIIHFDKLSSSSKAELEFILIDIINEREEEFVNFFNMAGPITIRKHSLELIPGIGKKHLKDLIEERESKKFESFEDIKSRCQFLADPQKAICNRILFEMENKEDIKLFIRK
jgi:putative nucleotide binding protein